MTTEEQFQSFKEHIMKEARAKSACAEEYRKAAKAEDMAAFCAAVRDNFHWLCSNEVLTGDVIDAYPALSDHGIRHNADASEGVLLVTGSATAEASGSATVRAWGSATVRASDSATVLASDSATVEAWGSATVRASGSGRNRSPLWNPGLSGSSPFLS